MAKERSPNTRDHIVPRMYLKRFGKSRGSDYRIGVSPADDLNRSFETGTKNIAAENGFYWGTDTDGVPHHHLEDFLTSLESDATPAFRRVLDSGKRLTDDALPPWPPTVDTRLHIAWWIAAQILRTVRQRNRLELEDHESLDPPSRFDGANRHIRYIIEMIEPLAANIFFRPWGVGFADGCLLTGDVPVLVMNGQDHSDQDAAVAFWDIYLPIDPHRCLYLPGVVARGRDPRLARDHRFKLHSGHTIGLNTAMAEIAVRHVFFHPDHDPRPHIRQESVIRNKSSELPHLLIWNDALDPEFGIERRWLQVHPPAREPEPESSSTGEDDALEVAKWMMQELETASDMFTEFTEHQHPAT